MRTNRTTSAVTLVEALVALAVLLALVAGLIALTRLTHRGTERVSALHQAVSSAERAAARLQVDLLSMLPPDPKRPELMPRIEGGGARLAFRRVVRRGARLAAVATVYELQAVDGGTSWNAPCKTDCARPGSRRRCRP